MAEEEKEIAQPDVETPPEVVAEPAPTAEVSVEESPVEEVPVQEVPVEGAVVEEPPVEGVAVEEAPVEAEESAQPAELPKLEPIKPRGPRIPLPSSLQEIVGALLFASETPLTANELRACVRGVAPEDEDDAEVMSVYQSCTGREIDQALRGLEKELERSGCGFRLVCSGGAYRLQTASQCGRYVRALLKLDRPRRLSRSSLETLAIIAYRQPITKAEIEQIRGVAVDTIVKSLVDLQLVRLVGRSELPGHPFLYGTSPLFLEHFGLASLSELNALDPTLQRSNPRERAKLFVKEKKPEEQPTLEQAAEEAKAAAAQADEAAVAAETSVEGGDEASAPEAAEDRPRRVSFRPDDEDELLDDTPDEAAEGDDESLVDEDDEPLVDDDESLVDDDEDEDADDESLVDDEDEDADDADDEEADEDDADEEATEGEEDDE